MLRGQTALVTGGAGGIGKAVVERFVAEGCSVAIADINLTTAQELADKLNAPSSAKNILTAGSEEPEKVTHAIAIKVDASDEEDVKRCIDTVIEQLGSLTILVNNAAKFTFGHLIPTVSEQQQEGKSSSVTSQTGTDRLASCDAMIDIMKVNLIGYRNFIKHGAQAMMQNELLGEVYSNTQTKGTSTIDARCRGSIINVSSVSGYIAQPEFVPYNCSKGAIQQLTRCCALDFAKLKIRVNGVCPGSIETDGSHNHMDLLGLSLEEGRRTFGDSCPMQRQAAPEEVAGVCLFLANNSMSSFVTGSHIVVDGGATMY